MTAAELECLARQSRQDLLAFAMRRARNYQDAEDAVQEALTIAFAVRERIRPDGAVGYIAITAGHEAGRLRTRAGRHRSLDEPLIGTPAWSLHDITPDPRHTSRDAVIDALDCLRCVKPDEARALMARALGWRYREICEAFAWTYTKTNRCVTEGRAAARRRLSAAVRP